MTAATAAGDVGVFPGCRGGHRHDHELPTGDVVKPLSTIEKCIAAQLAGEVLDSGRSHHNCGSTQGRRLTTEHSRSKSGQRVQSGTAQRRTRLPASPPAVIALPTSKASRIIASSSDDCRSAYRPATSPAAGRPAGSGRWTQVPPGCSTKSMVSAVGVRVVGTLIDALSLHCETTLTVETWTSLGLDRQN